MKFALFLGCTIPARSRNYELSARKVAEKLGIEMVDVKEFICCGFPLKDSDKSSFEIMAAYNLCLAQERNLDICTLCSSCAYALTEVAQRLSKEGAERDRVNEHLSKLGLQYRGGVKVRHFARILYEEIKPEEIKKHLKKDLSDLRVAIHYGCHYLKPSEIYDYFDDIDDPKSIETLLNMTGAQVVHYSGEKRCCGGPLLPVDEKTALSVAKEKMDALSDVGADALCLVCPFCSVMYDSNQKSIETEFGEKYQIPVLYLTQFLGLSMGYDTKELGLNMNVVKTGKLVKKYFE